MKFAIITPSYYLDFEKCRLLAQSVLKYLPEDVHHYIVIDRSDEALFTELESPRTHLIYKEDILPFWFIQLKFARKWWLNLTGLPVRGWIIQQLTKLSVDEHVDADVLIFVDSGAFFVQNFNPQDLVRNGKVPLFREQRAILKSKYNTRWHRTAAELFGIKPKVDAPDVNYVSAALVYMLRDNLTMMKRHIERVTGKSWVRAVCSKMYIAEYALYGCFCEEILKDRSNHYPYATINCALHWSTDPLDQIGLETLRKNLTPEQLVVMINEKSNTNMDLVKQVFQI